MYSCWYAGLPLKPKRDFKKEKYCYQKALLLTPLCSTEPPLAVTIAGG